MIHRWQKGHFWHVDKLSIGEPFDRKVFPYFRFQELHRNLVSVSEFQILDGYHEAVLVGSTLTIFVGRIRTYPLPVSSHEVRLVILVCIKLESESTSNLCLS